MDKLDPNQIRALAMHTKHAMENYPVKAQPEEAMTYAQGKEHLKNVIEMDQEPLLGDDMEEPWEACLRNLVDDDPTLPNYDAVAEDEMSDYLILYYTD